MDERKMLSRRSFLRMATVAGAGIVAAACTPKAAPTVAPTKPPAAQATAVPPTAVPAPSGPVSLRYAGMQSQAVEDEIVAMYTEANPDVTLEFEGLQWDLYTAKLAMEFAGGVGPDVGSVGDWGYDLVMRGAYAQLQPFIDADKDYNIDDHVALAVKDGTFNGVYCSGGGDLYALPMSLVVFTWFYNWDMMQELGFTKTPNDLYAEGNWDYDAVREIGMAAVKDTNGDGKLDQFGLKCMMAPYMIWRGIAPEWGVEIFNEDLTRCLANQPEIVEGLEVWTGFQTKDKFWPSSAAVDDQAKFENGRFVFQDAHSGWLGGFRERVTFDWDCAPWPSGPVNNKILLVVANWGVSASTAHPQESWDLLKYITGPEAQAKRVELRGAFPSQKSVLRDVFTVPKPPEHSQVMVDTAEDGFLIPHFRGFNDFMSECRVAVDSVLVGDKTCQEALDILKEKADMILSENLDLTPQ